VLAASARAQGIGSGDPHRRYLFARTRLSCFFRDDALSDAIGFDYQHWPAADAVADFTARLERIPKEPGSCACVILDGENPWDGYAHNGAAFLRTLYQQLGSHPRLRPATFSRAIEETTAVVHPLPPLVAGSWVHGQLLTWIGDVAKNRIWERLVRTKHEFDQAARAPDVQRLLGACEGSDWFWWADSRQGSHSPIEFDRLLELHLRNVERAIRPPATMPDPVLA
jgi:alpha-amylase/alpha-mannosidase (GH57 family)